MTMENSQSTPSSDWLPIDHKLLSEEALQGLIEAFVLQEGTDYGQHEYSLAAKTAAVRKQILSGKAKIVFHKELQQWLLVPSTRH